MESIQQPYAKAKTIGLKEYAPQCRGWEACNAVQPQHFKRNYMVIDSTKQYTAKQLIDNIKGCIGIEGTKLPTKSLNFGLYAKLPTRKRERVGLLLKEFMQHESQNGVTYINPVNVPNGELFEQFKTNQKAKPPAPKAKPTELPANKVLTEWQVRDAIRDYKDNNPQQYEFLEQHIRKQEMHKAQDDAFNAFHAVPKVLKKVAQEEILYLRAAMPEGLSPSEQANYLLQIPALLVQLANGDN
jgi:hypothetical protein